MSGFSSEITQQQLECGVWRESRKDVDTWRNRGKTLSQ